MLTAINSSCVCTGFLKFKRENHEKTMALGKIKDITSTFLSFFFLFRHVITDMFKSRARPDGAVLNSVSLAREIRSLASEFQSKDKL